MIMYVYYPNEKKICLKNFNPHPPQQKQKQKKYKILLKIIDVRSF